jgi:hypothetical protein
METRGLAPRPETKYRPVHSSDVPSPRQIYHVVVGDRLDKVLKT